MKITDMNNLYVGYSKNDDFCVLIAAGCDDKEEAQEIANEYVENAGLTGPMSVWEFTEENLNTNFDCDYVLCGRDGGN